MNTHVIKIFTDGSCNPKYNIGTWAAILLYDNEKIKLTGESIDTTHQRMELLAVIKSIEYIDEKFDKATLVIYTDSQYVVRIADRKDKLLKNKFITKKGDLLHNSYLIEALIRQIETHTIEFIKVKAHQKPVPDEKTGLEINAINYNIEVDKLARNRLRDIVNRAHPDL